MFGKIPTLLGCSTRASAYITSERDCPLSGNTSDNNGSKAPTRYFLKSGSPIVGDHASAGFAIFLAKSHLHGSVMDIRERIWAVPDPQCL